MRASIPCDLLNPGHVFACLGFMEAANVLCGEAFAGFDWTGPEGARFILTASGDENPFDVVTNFLAAASVTGMAPAGDLTTAGWKVPTEIIEGDGFPFPVPSSPATLPARLHAPSEPSRTLTIDHWGDGRSTTGRDNVKFWAGSGGYPGVALVRDALELLRHAGEAARRDPLNFRAEQSSSFRFDWRKDYIPMEIGFSLNAHPPARFSTFGYPLVELLAAIGLTHARPQFENKLSYRYGVLGVGGEDDAPLLDPVLLRAALGRPELPFPRRVFRMLLGWPGKENQARCITQVVEETTQ